MADIHIRTEGRAGRITLNRPQALNALTYAMCLEIDTALKDWAGDDEVALVLIDAEGDRAFSAGGDIAEMYETGRKGDYAYGRKFWADEYRLNAKLATPTQALHLQTREGAPLLRTVSLNIDAAGRPVEYGRTWFSGDRVTLTVADP